MGYFGNGNYSPFPISAQNFFGLSISSPFSGCLLPLWKWVHFLSVWTHTQSTQKPHCVPDDRSCMALFWWAPCVNESPRMPQCSTCPSFHGTLFVPTLQCSPDAHSTFSFAHIHGLHGFVLMCVNAHASVNVSLHSYGNSISESHVSWVNS